jgi:membrane protease YdiL (CAAX protease family)
MGGAAPVIGGSLAGVLVIEWLRVVFLGGPLEEELGWRGFVLPRLQASRSAWDAALVLGLVWGLWHIPLYLVPGTGQYDGIGGDLSAGAFTIGAFVVWTMGLSVLFTWLFNVTRGSLIVVILLHASVNLGSFVPAAVESTGAASLLYALATWIVAIVLVGRFGRATLAGPT